MSKAPPNIPACVIGDMDLVRPLGLAGISSVVVAAPGNPVLYSRFVDKNLSWERDDVSAEANLESLLHFGMSRSGPVVLFYQADPDLLLVSRYRDQLAKAFRFVIPEAALVEELTDKAKFQALAQRVDLPVPSAYHIDPSRSDLSDINLDFPFIIKPARHADRASDVISGCGKALLIENAGMFREFWPRLAEAKRDLLVQQAILGPESAIESYHVYVDQQGTTAAEFTGRKIRTYPVSCGHSTALETTDAADVKALGRDIVQKIDLRGVAKLDFKRGQDGKLYLLEINPRFNLWHHLGAKAGVNIPALVYTDLMELPRPASAAPRAGIRWCSWVDVRAAQAYGIPLWRWLLSAFRYEAKSTISWDDPMPLLKGVLSKVRRLLVHEDHRPRDA